MKHSKLLRRVPIIAAHIRISVRGVHPERFINACARENIEFRKLKKSGDELTLNIPLSCLETAEQLALRLMLDISSVKKSALVHMMFFAKSRLWLCCVLFCAVILLVISQCLVLNIEIVGNDTISDERIIWALKQEGVGIGSIGSKIDPQWLKPRILLRIPELSWFYINVKGNTATVNVREHTKAPDVIDEKMLEDLIAQKNGLVKNIEVHSGSAAVKCGDMVTKGDVLISSKVESEYISARYVRAAGVVSGTTWYTVKLKMPLTGQIKEYTGREKTVKSVIFSGKRINLSILYGIPYGFYDKITSYNNFTLPGGYSPPFTIIKETYKEFTPSYIALDSNAVQAEAERCIRELVENELGENGSINDIRTDASVLGETLIVRAYIQCSEILAQ